MAGPLQFGSPDAVPEWVLAFAQVTDVLSALLGIAIAYVAWRGYRRNGSRPMLILSVGFVLALAVPFGLLLVFVAAGVPQGVVSVVSQASQVVGLGAILYALWMPA
jgi:hypothetical protein